MAHYQAVVRNKLGGIVPGANVSVFETGTSTLADLFSDEALTTSIENPTQADNCGKVDFYIASGEYDILVQRFDIEDVRFDDVSILENAPTGFSPKYLTAFLSADQTSNVATGNHIEFDSIQADSGHVTLSTGTGQANGIFTLPAGTWRLTAYSGIEGLDGRVDIRWGVDGGAPIGQRALLTDNDSPVGNRSPGNMCGGIVIVTSGTKDVIVEIVTQANTPSIESTFTFAIIEALS